MKKKQTQQASSAVPVTRCGTCKNGEYLTAYVDYQRRPILVACPFSEFARLRSHVGCAHWGGRV